MYFIVFESCQIDNTLVKMSHTSKDLYFIPYGIYTSDSFKFDKNYMKMLIEVRQLLYS